MSEENTKILNSTFQSPIPLLFKIRDFVFGKRKPGVFTRITFFINLFSFIVFAVWSAISYFLLLFRELFLKEKGVDVDAIIESRGKALGFSHGVFIERLEFFHAVSLICWGVLFFSLILLWRKKSSFVFFYFASTIIYFASMLLYLGIDFYLEDTTFFDKSVFLAMNAYTFLYFILTSQEVSKVEEV